MVCQIWNSMIEELPETLEQNNKKIPYVSDNLHKEGE